MPTPEKETKWVCPVCGDDKVQGCAWVNVNTKELVSWDECNDFFCQVCEDRGEEGHTKRLEEVAV